MQKNFIQSNCEPELADKILRKLDYLHPPQPILNPKLPSLDDTINFVFIGRDFFMKGGYEIVQAFSEARKKYSNFRLYLVGKLRCAPNHVSRTSPEDVEKAKAIIASSPFIEHCEELPNRQALALLKKCHVGLLPTYQDTYGYSVLEMQASALPCVTTDGRALAEINNDDIGWLIRPDKRINIYTCSSRSDIDQFKASLKTRLRNIIENILENPEIIRVKSEKSLARIKNCHDPGSYGDKLNEYYGEFLKLSHK